MIRAETTLPLPPPVVMDAPVASRRGTPSFYLGRQPVIDQGLRLYGYELFLRAGVPDAGSDDAEDAVQRMIDHYRMLVPDEAESHFFLTCTRTALLSRKMLQLPQRTVFEIGDDILPDAEVLACCRNLRKRGYHFALEGSSLREDRQPFLELANFVKVDLSASTADERRQTYAAVKPSGAKLLAQNVNTEAERARARAEGCTLFQGYFFAQPYLSTTPQSTAVNHLVYLRILAALSSPSPEVREIEKMVLADPVLCFRLLQLVNSALYSLPSHVSSVRSAILLLGLDEVRRLVAIGLASSYTNSKHRVLAHLTLERARFCEMLAPLLQQEAAEIYLMGMLSLIDVMLQTPLDEVLESLPILPEMKAALAGEQNSFGTILHFVRRYEACDWTACDVTLDMLGITEQQAAATYVESVRWAATAMPR